MRLAATMILLGYALLVASVALAQQHHDPHHKDFYQHWKQPGTNVSCCNARIETDGIERGDCEPTKAEIRNGDWYAWLRQESRWIKIEDARIVRERNPAGQDAHLCYTPLGGVLCFVPMDTGG